MSFTLDEYSTWAKMLAKNYTEKELLKKLNNCEKNRDRLSGSHLRAIDKTTSMSSNSARRASTRASMSSNYEEYMALKNAIEIKRLFPEFSKEK